MLMPKSHKERDKQERGAFSSMRGRGGDRGGDRGGNRGQ